MLGFVLRHIRPFHLILASVLLSGFLKSWSAGVHEFQQIIVLARSAQQRSGTRESVCGGSHFMLAFSRHAENSCDSTEDQPAVLRQPQLEVHQLKSATITFLFSFFFLSLPLSCLSLELAIFGCVCPWRVGPSAV